MLGEEVVVVLKKAIGARWLRRARCSMPEREVQSLAYWLRAELGYIDFYDRRQD